MSSNIASGSNMLLGHGELYFDRLSSTGARTGEKFLGDIESLSLTGTVETKEKYSHTTSAGELLARAIIRSSQEVALQFNEYMARNLAMFLLGDDSSPITQTGAAVVDELINSNVAIPSADAWYPLAFRGSVANPISAVTVKVLAATKVLGTDYQVDAITGRIYIIAGGSIVPGTDIVKVSYTYPTLTSGSSAIERVLIGTRADVTGFLRFIGVPAAGQGPKMELKLWKVNFAPDGNLAFVGDDFGNYGLKGLALADGIHTGVGELNKLG